MKKIAILALYCIILAASLEARTPTCRISVLNDKNNGSIYLVPSDKLGNTVSEDRLEKFKRAEHAEEDDKEDIKADRFYIYSLDKQSGDYIKHLLVQLLDCSKRQTISLDRLERGWFDPRVLKVTDYLHGAPPQPRYSLRGPTNLATHQE